MKNFLVITIKWGMPGFIALIFLILPGLVQNDTAHPVSWVVRIFLVVFLSTSFFGAAKVFNDPSTVKEGVDKYRNSDKDLLILSYVFGHLLYVISAIGLFYYGLAILYPLIGWWKYSFAVLYGILISAIHYNIYIMQVYQIRENEIKMK